MNSKWSVRTFYCLGRKEQSRGKRPLKYFAEGDENHSLNILKKETDFGEQSSGKFNLNGGEVLLYI